MSWAILPLINHNILFKSKNDTYKFILVNKWDEEKHNAINFDKCIVFIDKDEYILNNSINLLYDKAISGYAKWFMFNNQSFEVGYWIDGNVEIMRDYASISRHLHGDIDHELFTTSYLTFEKKHGKDQEVYKRELFGRILNNIHRQLEKN
jgi:hypothetical protein